MTLRQTWTKAEESKVIGLVNIGRSYHEIANEIGRTPEATSVKLSRLKAEGKLVISSVPASTFPIWDKPLTTKGDALILSDVEAPYQHSEFINHCLDLADAWGIQTLHLAGDLLHYSALSAWGSEWTQQQEELAEKMLDFIQTLKGKSKAEGVKLLEDSGLIKEGGYSGEIGEARKVFKSMNSFKEIIVDMGNHDDRLLRTLDQAVNPGELLHQMGTKDDPRWKIAPYYYSMIETDRGTFRVTHPRGSAKNTAIDLAVQFHQHIVMGHSHRWAVNRDPSGEYWAIQTGCCVDEKRLAYVQQRDAKRDAHVLGATIIRGGYPFVLSPESPWDMLKRM